MSKTHEYSWVELTLTLTPDDLDALVEAGHATGDPTGIIEHILTLARDKYNQENQP